MIENDFGYCLLTLLLDLQLNFHSALTFREFNTSNMTYKQIPRMHHALL